jgi:protein-tyrosine phosphatase
MRGMSEPARFDLSRDDGAAALAAALAALGRGELVVVPTETVYGVAAREDLPAGRARLDTLKGARTTPYSLAVASPESLRERLAPWPRTARRIAARWWPGPVTQLLPARSGELLGLRVPGHPWTRALAEAAGVPLLLASANSSGRPAPVAAGELAPEVLAAVSVVVDGGRAALGEASTVVEPRPTCLRLVREGVVGRADLLRHARPEVLVVCTGNTCRSPMAERLLQRALQAAAAAEPGLLEPLVRSAGVHADEGQPPSAAAVEALAALGLDLSDHATRPLRPELLSRADLVLCMTAAQAELVAARLELDVAPAERPPLELFDPDGQDVPDPFGGDRARYAAVARQLERLARRRAEHLLQPWRPAA